MADEARVEVHGLRELEAGARRLAHNVQSDAPDAFRRVADTVAGRTRGRMPRVSGRLAGSVVAAPTSTGAVVGYGSGVPYAGWIDFGGGHGRPYIPGGRYFFPTAEALLPELDKEAERHAEREIASMLWPSPNL